MQTTSQTIMSPFGGDSRIIQTLPTSYIREMYQKKCGIDINSSFKDNDFAYLFECNRTGYRFWRPAEIAGDEHFYQLLSKAWPNYYKTHRWEYPVVRKALQSTSQLLEIGCGRGYFLKSMEGHINNALGLELNSEAIANKVTRFPIESWPIEELAQRSNVLFDAICSFQVLEHIPDPKQFIESALKVLSPNGLLILSTPNFSYKPHQEQQDAMDLPPHHIGHFDENTYKRIANFFNLKVVTIESEIRKHVSEAVTDSTQNSLAFKISRAVAAIAYNTSYAWTKEPGPNLLAIYQKREQ